jgi:hypothetical protein
LWNLAITGHGIVSTSTHLKIKLSLCLTN